MKPITLVLALTLFACQSGTFQDSPFVQKSVTDSPRWTIDLKRILDGVYRTYRPRCMDSVRVGHTIEFRNFLPDIPTNITSIAGPQTLYSPNLTRPYNYISADDPDNTLCKSKASDGSCAEKNEWSYWRFTFGEPGVYDWLDTNSGAPGQQVVDPYYGTVTFVGRDPNSPFGTVCVKNEDGTGCENVCCTSDEDCTSGKKCFRQATDSVGTCLTPSG